jgi:hypothetical protein
MRSRASRAGLAALITLAAAVATAIAGQALEAAAPEPGTSDLARAHERRFEAMVAGDAAALAELLADELTYAHSDGRVETRAELLASIASGALRYLAIRSEGESVIRRYGGDTVGVITGAGRFRVRLGEREGEVSLRYTSVYVHRDGRWQLAAWHSSAVRAPA